jgi:branched-chain amino acid transport system permease protein
MSLEFILSQFMSGLSQGMIIMLIALGLSLVFGTLKVINFAHGSLYMLGAYFCYSFVRNFSGTPAHFWLALIFAPLVVGAVGGVIEILFFRAPKAYRLEHIYQLLLTYSLVLIIGDIAKLIWGIDYKVISKPGFLSGGVRFWGVSFPTYNIFLICLTPIVFLGLMILINKTRLGRLIRAITADREIMGTLGVNVSQLYTVVFILGAWLAGLGGALIAPVATISPGMDVVIIIECFMIIIIGGSNSMLGTLLGAILFGQFNAFGILIAPRLAIVFPFILMAIVLIIRPWGLLGKPER